MNGQKLSQTKIRLIILLVFCIFMLFNLNLICKIDKELKTIKVPEQTFKEEMKYRIGEI